MAAARDTTNANIKPLEGAIVQKVQAGATIDAGEIITLQDDGKWDPTTTASAAQLTVAVALQDGSDTTWLDAVVFGPVKNMTGATIGGLIYASDTAGELSETAGTKSTIVGYAKTATVLFVQPQIVDLT
jgi:hypothetical protein